MGRGTMPSMVEGQSESAGPSTGFQPVALPLRCAHREERS
jgi:hypothetical protein